MSHNKEFIVPVHLGLILDGNRRWAEQRGVKPIDGHKKGFDTFKTISDECLRLGVRHLSVYAFSTENWQRSKDEVKFLMNFISIVIDKHINELIRKNIRFLWFGREDGLDKKIIKKLRKAEEISKNNDSATFELCFNYGGQQELVDSFKAIAYSDQEITESTVRDHLYGGSDVPDVDLIIRTSGEKRLSNFMLWRSAYSELYFSDKLWPDFSIDDLHLAIDDYSKRKRRFGS